MQNFNSKLKILLISFFILLGFFCLAESSQAATIYVDNTTTSCSTPSDNDYDPATDTCGAGSYAVYNTINDGANATTAGDTVIVADGTYDTFGEDTYIVFMRDTGTAGNIITIKAETKGGAIVTCGGKTTGWNGFVFNTNVSYVTIQDFKIHNCNLGIFINNNNDYNTFQGNEIYNINQGIGVGSDCDYVTIDSNKVHDFGIAADNQYHAIYPRGIDATIQNNIVYNNLGAGWSLHFGAYTTPPSGTWKIINNTLTGTANVNNTCIVSYSENITNLYIHNNICFGATSGLKYTLGTWDAGWEAKNNLVENSSTICYPGGTGACTLCDGTRCINNLTNVDPKFVDRANGNFHLLSNSPAINAGLATYAPALDYDGDSRPQGGAYDIGAYEYVGIQITDTTSPACPVNLTVQ